MRPHPAVAATCGAAASMTVSVLGSRLYSPCLSPKLPEAGQSKVGHWKGRISVGSIRLGNLDHAQTHIAGVLCYR